MNRRLGIRALLVAVACAAILPSRSSAAPSLSYHFILEREPQLRLRVRLETQGNEKGETTFEVSREWGGVATGGDDISDVHVHDSKGKDLVVEPLESHRWRVKHKPGTRLVLEYAFLPNTNQDDPSPDTNRRPIMNAHLFHAYGFLAVAIPTHLDAKERREIEWIWDGFEPAGWNVADSFGIGPGPRHAIVTLPEWGEAVFMAGEIDIVRRDVEKRPVWVALAGHEWTFSIDAFADMVQKIVAVERGFFLDYDTPYYLVTAIPVGKAVEHGGSLGGNGLTNSFSLEMLPNTPLEGRLGHGLNLSGLLAHEMFHTWNGHTIEPEDPEQLVYWFTEGFTDFYMRRLLLRGGLITREEYVESVNAKLAEFMRSPVRNAPNERIRADFWHSAAVKQLPYQRGEIVAMMADGAIRRASGGDQSLDDLMRTLVAEGRGSDVRFSTEELLQRIEDLSDAATGARLRAIVVDGVTPEISPDVFEPCLELRVIDIVSFDLGFDFDRSRETKQVTAIRTDSKAYEAGLRNGQKLSGVSINWGDTTQPIVITIEDSTGSKRSVSYLPLGSPVPTPQFAPRAAAKPADCGRL